MPECTLHGCRIVVVEDEYMLAQELCAELLEAGAIVLGPAGSVQAAIDLINSEKEIDGAILDVNLRGEMSFPAADLLMARGVPFVLTTGYDQSIVPSHLQHAGCFEKPLNMTDVAQAIGHLIHD